jgi:hypothetical protein
MKYLKMLALSAASIAALVVLIGAGSASATVLCSTTTTTCNAPYGVGTVVHMTLESGSSLILEQLNGATTKTCTEATIKGTTAQQGSHTSTVAGVFNVFTLASCTQTASVLNSGSFEIHHIAGTDNGTLTLSDVQITTNTIFGSCVYGSGKGLLAGTLIGGTKPKVSINTILPKVSGNFACPAEQRLTAEYTITQPTPVYVEPG